MTLVTLLVTGDNKEKRKQFIEIKVNTIAAPSPPMMVCPPIGMKAKK